MQKVAVSAQARNDFTTYVAEDIDYSHVLTIPNTCNVTHTSGRVFSV